MMSTLMRAMSASLLLCLLWGCGGGGGGAGGETTNSGGTTSTPGTNSGNSPATPRYATVTGTATKGMIGKAMVNAYTVNDDGSRGALLGAAQTDENGRYTLSILAQSSPVWVELNSGPGAFMSCDSLDGCGEASDSSFDTNNNGLVDLGERMPLPTGFSLRALLPDAEDGVISAAITPLTHLAASFAATFPQGVDGLSVAMANSQVANLFSLDADILATTVPDLNSPESFSGASEAARQYAVLLGAFAALAEDGDFNRLLQQAAAGFAELQGQLATRSDDPTALTLSRWAAKAVALAQHLDQQTLVAAFTTLKGAADIAEGDTTNAAPDNNISSNELEGVKRVISQVHALRSNLDVTSATAPLPGFSPLLQTTNGLVETSEAFSRSSRLGAFVAVPKLALEGACNSISNFLTAYLCRSIVGNKSLEEICAMTFSNLSIGGKTLCEYLNALRLPAGNNLIAELALMDGAATLEGTYQGTHVSIQMGQGVTSDNSRVTMAWSGDLDNDSYALHMQNGTIDYVFDSLTSFTALNHPRSIDSSFDAALALKSDQVSRFDGTATTTINLTDEDNPQTTTQLIGNYTNALGHTSAVNLGMSLQSGYNALLSATFAHPDSGSTVALALAQSASGVSARLQWAGNTLNVATNYDTGVITLDDGDKVRIELMPEDDTVSGSMTYSGKPYGDVVWEDGGLVVELPNGQRVDLL